MSRFWFLSRATTYYLADRRYDMLPAVLSADLCSLLGGVDRSVDGSVLPPHVCEQTEHEFVCVFALRYAMSVLWELDAHTLEVAQVWYGRTLIRSSYQLHYELAQALLNGEPAEVPELAQLDSADKDAKLAQLTQALDRLTNIARHLRAQRDRGGALELEGVEVGGLPVFSFKVISSERNLFTFESIIFPRCVLSWTRRRTSQLWSLGSRWRSMRRWPSV